MKISEAIAAIKHGCRGQMNGKPANDEKDRILFGQDHVEDELTGIVVCATATVDVIRRAVELGANLIMSNAGLFWSHGDPTDWLAGNEIFEAKRALLAQNGIVVWRNFEYVISGIPVEGGYIDYIDGMAYGFAKTMGWDQYLDVANAIANPADFFFKYEFPEPVSVAELARQCRERAGLVGVTVVGDKDVKVRRLATRTCGPRWRPSARTLPCRPTTRRRFWTWTALPLAGESRPSRSCWSSCASTCTRFSRRSATCTLPCRSRSWWLVPSATTPNILGAWLDFCERA